MSRKPKTKIVEAVGIAAVSLSEGGEALGKAMEAAMQDAVNKCYADGVSDPDVIRERMAEARELVAANWAPPTADLE